MQGDTDSAVRTAARVRKSAITNVEKIFLLAGVAIAHGFMIHIWLYPSGHDALGYVLSARDIATDGLFSKFHNSDVRTYGYPAFLVVVQGLADASRLPFHLVLLEAQLLLYVGAAFLIRGQLIQQYSTAARIVFCGLLANYYAMIYASESLGESLSLTLTLIAAACWLRMSRDRNGGTALIIGSLIVGCAVMIRPANLFLVAAWVVGCGLLAVRHHVSASKMLCRLMAMLIAISLPAIPQIINNLVHYNSATPLVTYDLTGLQHNWGVKLLKYATGMPPVPQPQILYDNPLLDGTSIDTQQPLRWYVDYPVAGVATVALHVFNLTDQDLTFTYARDLDPWYRRPLSVINHAVIALGIVGFALFARRNGAGRKWRPTEALIGLMLLLAANLAIYSLSAVEMRFGLTLLLAMFPLAGYGIHRAIASKSPRVRVAIIGFVMAYVIGAMLLSDWVRSQSPQISAAVAANRLLEASLVPRCPFTFAFAFPARGEGWGIPERHPDGGFAMWMGARRAWMTLPVNCKGPVQVRLFIDGYLARDILDGLRLQIDGTDVPLTLSMAPDGGLQLQGSGPSLRGLDHVRIEMNVPRTIVPDGGDRTLAVMFRRLEIKPVDANVVN